MSIKTQASIEELYQEQAKAEIVNGEVIRMSPTGDLPASAGVEIVVSLREYSRRTQSGRVYGDNTGFLVNLAHRKSFSPDVAYHAGKRTGAKFLQGAPMFAVEIRSEGDYGEKAERAMAAKRKDYFAAGTRVVWDVDVLRAETIRVYRADDPGHPAIYERGQTAEAEPTLPGWKFAVEQLFA